MKLFRLLSTTAVTVLAIAALAVSASAMTATYDAATGKATISGITLNESAAQKTLLILNKDATTVAEDDIVQIDQAADFTTVTVGNLTADIDKANNDALATYATALATYETALNTYESAEKTEETYATVSAAYTTVSAAYTDLTEAFTANAKQIYHVRVGGNGVVDPTTQVAFDACEMTVQTTVTNIYAEPTAPEEPEEDEPAYKLGDFNMDNSGPDANDISEIIKYMFGKLGSDADVGAEKLSLGDVDASGSIDANDISEIIKFMFGKVDSNFQPVTQ